MWKIKNLEIANPVVIAPMAGISNAAFRTIAHEFGAGLIYTEMISDKAICYSNKKTMDCLLYTSPSPRDRQKSRMPSSA